MLNAQFTDSAVANFGSGWTWLVNINGKLEIQNTSNAESPVTLRVKPLLTLDVWEHAYYLDHQNRRPVRRYTSSRVVPMVVLTFL